MKILKQQKKAYHPPYLKCFHHITVEQILAGSSSVTGGTDGPESGEGIGDGDLFPTKQASFFFEEEEEEGDEESGYYW